MIVVLQSFWEMQPWTAVLHGTLKLRAEQTIKFCLFGLIQGPSLVMRLCKLLRTFDKLFECPSGEVAHWLANVISRLTVVSSNPFSALWVNGELYFFLPCFGFPSAVKASISRVSSMSKIAIMCMCDCVCPISCSVPYMALIFSDSLQVPDLWAVYLVLLGVLSQHQWWWTLQWHIRDLLAQVLINQW